MINIHNIEDGAVRENGQKALVGPREQGVVLEACPVAVQDSEQR